MQKIIFTDSLSKDLTIFLSGLTFDKIFILVDENTQKLCLPKIKDIQYFKNAHILVSQSGEDNKTLSKVVLIWNELVRQGATRHSLIINLGGGLLTDLGGFGAACFKRGLRFINIPTTVLSAVDAAVGGKTGVNFEGLKNEIGIFKEAEAVFISTDFYHTLPLFRILDGMAEMLKHACLKNDDMVHEVLSFELQHLNWEQLKPLIQKSIALKEEIVLSDPQEESLRKALNLGHTIGHAFESYSHQIGKPISHGFAVAHGLCVELYLSHKICGFPISKITCVMDYIRQNYPGYALKKIDYDYLYALMQHDKKNLNAKSINFTLLKDFGQIKINQVVDQSTIFSALDLFAKSYFS